MLDAAAAAKADDGTAAEAEDKNQSTDGQSDSKIDDEDDDDDDDDDDDEGEGEDKNGDFRVVPTDDSGADGTEEQTVRNPLSEEPSSARETISTNDGLNAKQQQRTQSLAPELDQIFERPPSHETLERTSKEAQVAMMKPHNKST